MKPDSVAAPSPLLLVLSLLGAVLWVPSHAWAQTDAPDQPDLLAEVLSSMDSDADPCQDFYRYACGGWLDATELPADEARWARSFSVIRERNREAIRDILEDARKNPGPPGTDRYRIGRFYGSCLDEQAIEDKGLKPVEGLLRSIDQADDTAALFGLAGRLQRRDVEAFAGLGVLPDFKDPDLNLLAVGQGGLGLPDRDYYVSEDPNKQDVLEAYEAHVAEVLELSGMEPEAATSSADAVVAFETRLAEAARPRAEMRNPDALYHRLDRSGLEKLSPGLAWDAFFAGLGQPTLREINVLTPEFFEALETSLGETELSTLQAYLRWHVLNAHAELLPKRFADAAFEFYGKTLQGRQERQVRWKECVDATEDALGEAVGKLYVEEMFPGDSKDVALTMIRDIETAFEENLPELAWMDAETRHRAVEKMEAIQNKIGYPDEWKDYSSLHPVPDDYFSNAVAARDLETERELRKVGQPVDPKEWGMTPQMVNAYYNPLQNEIAFPAGILQPPFFYRDYPPAMNYGAVGTVMGHELTHGFDDQGRKFDPEGRLREWWAPEVAERFETQAQCVEDQYSAYEVEPDLNVQGDLTLGENIADIGGLKQSWEAYRRWKQRFRGEIPTAPGLTDEQLFFVSYAQIWCSKSTPEVTRMRVTVDSHSPPQFRVIGPISNHPAFAETFECAPGTPMNPEDKCLVW